ncbi:hypothetical protein LLG95_18065 [bacterium]|nr:hypothetical protein [bacterium]
MRIETKRGFIVPMMLALLFFIPQGRACATSWVDIPLSQLVDQSDTIVIGRMIDSGEQHPFVNRIFDQVGKVAPISHDVTFEGIIVVDKVLLGRVKSGDHITLKWTWPTYFPVKPGQTGIWLLTTNNGHLEANYPWRFRNMSDQPEIVRRINAPVALTADEFMQDLEKDIHLTLRIRNHTNKPLKIPRLDLSRADVTTTGTKPVNIILNFHKDRASTETMTIAAQQERDFPLILNKILKLNVYTTYRIQAAIDGLPISSRLELWIYTSNRSALKMNQ